LDVKGKNMDQQKTLLTIVGLILAMMILLVANRYDGFNFAFNFFGGGNANDGLPESSLQKSIQICKNEARTSLGPALSQMQVDRISTRYDQSTQSHWVFINIQIKGKERDPYYMECNVSTFTQKIRHVRLNGPPNEFQFNFQ